MYKLLWDGGSSWELICALNNSWGVIWDQKVVQGLNCTGVTT